MGPDREAYPLSRSANWPEGWLAQTFVHTPKDMGLYRCALTHRSASGSNNERLEFLGDAVLNMLAGEWLFERFPAASEGDLSRFRSALVSETPLAQIALELGIGEQLQLGSGELKTGGFRRESILADALEALIGAVYLDAGLPVARDWVRGILARPLAQLPDADLLKDPKTRLQEYLQARGLALAQYQIERIEGEAHAQHFSVRCELTSPKATTFGAGSSRRRAEQQAAAKMLQDLQHSAQGEVEVASER